MPRFNAFVIFADMRTGSNFLETNLTNLEGVVCHGEAYNPSFIGYPKRKETLGFNREDRDADPKRFYEVIKAADGLNGFRFFHDHDPRVLDKILSDRSCAKIVLTRNPLDSYLSLKIAKETGQWKMTDVTRQRVAQVRFEPQEFEDRLTQVQMFQNKIRKALQTSGQTAFYVDYEELGDIDVLNGLARFLGVSDRLKKPDTRLKRQNPGRPAQKVVNPEEMSSALAQLDPFSLWRGVSVEPRRRTNIPSFVAAPQSPLLFMPVPAGPVAPVKAWLAALDGQDEEALQTDFTQKKLRHWKRQAKQHRCFTVVRHPVARAHAAFCDRILSTDAGAYLTIRAQLRDQFNLPIPEVYPHESYDAAQHKDAFLAFLRFVKANLSGQTSIRVDGHWASQSLVISGFADFALPDAILREDQLEDDLAGMVAAIDQEEMPKIGGDTDFHAEVLREIYDEDVEALVRDTYQRDYMMFGFKSYA